MKRLLILATLALSGCGSGDDAIDASRRLDTAHEMVERGQLREAQLELKQLLQSDPDNADARHALGRVYLYSGDEESANKELQSAVQLGLESAALSHDIVRVRILAGRYQAALDEIGRLRKTAGPAAEDEATLQTLEGLARLGLNQLGAAAEALEHASRIAPDRAEPRIGLAKVALLRGDLAQAAVHAQAAVDTNESMAQALMLLGNVELRRNELASAEDAFRRAIALANTNVRARVELVRVLLARNDPDAAETALNDIAQLPQDNPLRNYLRAQIARQRGDLSGATTALLDVLRAVPNHPPSLLALAAAYFEQKKYVLAEEYAKTFVANEPRNPAGHKLLAATYMALDEPAEAVKTLAPLAATSNDPQLIAILGSAYMRMDDFTRGTDFLRKAVEIAPEAATYRTQLAALHLATGRTSEALSELNTAVNLDDQLTGADIMIVLTHLRNRAFDKAEAAARDLVRRRPQDPVPHNLLGTIAQERGDRDAARGHFADALRLNPAFHPARLNLARLDIIEQRPADAKATYEQVLAADPDNVHALVALARFASAEGRQDDALAMLERARAADARAVEPRIVLADYYMRRGSIDEAAKVVDEMTALRDDRPTVIELQGRLQLARGQFDQARDTYTRVVARLPESARAHHQLGFALLRLGKLRQAATTLERARALDRANISTAVMLAITRLRLGQEEAAMAIARDLREQHPTNTAGAVLEGDIWTARADMDRAAQAYRAAVELDPTPGNVAKLSQALRRAGRADEAKRLMEQRMAAEPDDVRLRVVAANELMEAGDLAGARAAFEQLAQDAPQNAAVLNNLAWLYGQAGDERALDVARRAYELAPDRPEFQDTYGSLLIAAGNLDQGLDLLARAAAASPGNAEIRYHLAEALSRKGSSAAAAKELEEILKSDRPFPSRGKAENLLNTLKVLQNVQ